MEDAYSDIDISVVTPVFNGSKTIRELFQRTKKCMDDQGLTFEVIFVDDFSSDDSWKVIQQLKKTFPNYIVGVRLAKNVGQHNATLCGISHSKGSWIVTMDDDLEYEPENIPLLIQQQQVLKVDLIYGVLKQNKKSFIRRVLSSVYKTTAKYIEGVEKCSGSSFRLFKGILGKSILEHQRSFSFIDEFFHWHTSSISSIEIEISQTVQKKSRYSILNLGILTKELIFISSTAPLRFVTLLGTLMVVVNFIAGVVTIYRRLVLTIDEKGYTSIIVVILFSSGLIILCLGIIAEYISKLLKIGYNKPAYIESEKI